MFSDFARMMNFDDELKYYADYLYLCDYQDEKKENVNEYKSVVPKSPLTVATDTLTEKLESIHAQNLPEPKNFFQKMLSK